MPTVYTRHAPGQVLVPIPLSTITIAFEIAIRVTVYLLRNW